MGVSLLIAPFGASCVLVFGLPRSPLAQPRNVVGGHVISSAVGLICLSVLGASPVSFGLGVGVAIAVMLLTRTTHPPAGADPIVVILVGASWQFLFLPAFSGALIIVIVGIVFHRCVTGEKYPTTLAK
ncbi:HPP family protein [Methylobacterium sp. E-045]|uniref:HPP family protein n=1 Tax=Methylobacterium sp. E-045 TaxID=2836575 RepID=UPI001FBBF2D0|nr:HPP family protein [Methylobacterium sp. E-045]MCJ2131155.1 HPP family protein [Methylobacterium sp. E-045]